MSIGSGTATRLPELGRATLVRVLVVFHRAVVRLMHRTFEERATIGLAPSAPSRTPQFIFWQFDYDRVHSRPFPVRFRNCFMAFVQRRGSMSFWTRGV